MHSTDVVIVGAGPIGLELAVNLRALGVDYLHLDAGQVGQTIAGYPRQARFFSSADRIAIAGVPLHTADQTKATGEQYVAYLHAVATQFDLPVRTFEPATSVQRGSDGRFTVTTTKATYDAAHVVLAIGDMHLPRQLGVPGEGLPHVSHFFDEPTRYFRQDLLIVGGRNSAVEAALRCFRAGARVTISYRRDRFDEKVIKYWLMPELDALIKSGGIRFLPSTVVDAIEPGRVTLARCDPTSGSEAGEVPRAVPGAKEVAADFVLLLTGYVQDTTLFEAAGVTLEGENRAPRHDPATMMTDVSGLYVAGTAAAGTQHRFKLYIENSHPHVPKVVRSITGRDCVPGLLNPVAKTYGLPES
jgi:thioredoxin reductase (NADPH)